MKDIDQAMNFWISDYYYLWVTDNNIEKCKRYYILPTKSVPVFTKNSTRSLPFWMVADKTELYLRKKCTKSAAQNYFKVYLTTDKIAKFELRKQGHNISGELYAKDLKSTIERVLSTYSGDSMNITDYQIADYIYTNISNNYVLPKTLIKYYQLSYPSKSLKNVKGYRKLKNVDPAQLTLAVMLYDEDHTEYNYNLFYICDNIFKIYS